jgi:hypothetical protein
MSEAPMDKGQSSDECVGRPDSAIHTSAVSSGVSDYNHNWIRVLLTAADERCRMEK